MNRVQVRVSGSGPTKGLAELSVASQRDQTAGWAPSQRERHTARSWATPLRQPGREKYAQSCNNPIPARGACSANHSIQSHQPVRQQQLLNHSFLNTTNPPGILAMCPSHVSLAALRICMTWGIPAAAHN
eukprot:358009-Chlamydomonas_euryale.AAC.5